MTFLRYDLGVQLCHRVGTDAASLEGVYYHGSVVASDNLLLCDFQLISPFFIGFHWFSTAVPTPVRGISSSKIPSIYHTVFGSIL